MIYILHLRHFLCCDNFSCHLCLNFHLKLIKISDIIENLDLLIAKSQASFADILRHSLNP